MNIGSISKDQEVYNLIKKGLDASTERSKATADNIANINTKGYKRKYVTFEETLQSNMDDLDLKTTDDKHIKLQENYGQINTKTDNSTSMNEDGNNVDIENEKTNQAANTLMYMALLNQANSRLTSEKYVISGK
ncbi:flagellar basal body rod protein FlgB [Clostridium carboxidivorans P7]|uniref:Flagellar basal body rod protein FlgB n=1 Tax=Clostridium carboxidivorans P7 TaxID=536227 RepID=C6PPF6_9CLOT|nr:flagellar basal body rod protein FlgB [Clostridium carboxidivorans]AKN33946.1 flagellar basal body rod protein FlgB [Clostridium carboxidivorans P7]EET88850.1 flagellar basal-body rod protein FlgB [Clostridium carboxidivorans P7]EFG88180.1 flagellar basal-body rod protein FlgB [Clostridium carboxidivorans P7]